MRKIILFICVVLATGLSAGAAGFGFSNLIGDNMVLQQNAQAHIWGFATPGSVVNVKASWVEAPVSAETSSDGTWEVYVKTPSATFEPQTITASCGSEQVKAGNILIGEVWICSGQSNMEMPLRGWDGMAIEGSLYEMAMSGRYGAVRSFNVERQTALVPASDVKGQWQVSGPDTAGSFSAVGWFFATSLYDALNVPVGFVNVSWGGSVIEAWMGENLLRKCPDVNLKNASDKSVNDMYKPMVMYNGMFKPCSRLGAAGILWFQGESNISIATEHYAERLTAMAQLWRKDLSCGDVPFLIVELTPYDYSDGQYGLQDEHGPLLREQQFIASGQIPNAALIGTNDLAYEYERMQIHQSQKRKIGERACYQALRLAYGYPALPAQNPSFRSLEIAGGKVTVHFDNAEQGFMLVDEISGFEIAGEGGFFKEAKAEFGPGGTIILSCDSVPSPRYVRYCFHDFVKGTVKGINGLPLIPFRSDISH